MLNKLVALSLLPMLCLWGSSSSTIVDTNNTSVTTIKSRSISDLTPIEKKAFIEHLKTTGSCEWKGFKLYGKVQFVSSFADFKIKYVSSFPDIKVKFVSSFPDDCGEWQEVTSFPDIKVQVVTSFPDLKVQKVTSFPGM